MSHPLKNARKPKPRKREPLRTPEGEDFRKEAGKLDNWLNHHRITEHFKPSQNGKSEKNSKDLAGVG